MSTAPVRPTRQEVQKRAEEIKEKLLNQFSDVDVEYALWEDINGDRSSYWEHRGFPLIRYNVHACILIRGDQESTEAAASVADGEVAHLLEETDVIMQVQRTNHVICKDSK